MLAVVAAIINSRPLSLRVSTEGEYHALAPRDILFGRASRALDTTSRALDCMLDQDQDVAVQNMCEVQAQIVQAWRSKWLDTVFPDMVTRPKWRSASRNLQIGDIGHVKYNRTIGQHEWRLAMVETAVPDDDGVVRTVTVAFRPRNKRDNGKPYVSKNAHRLQIGVQRFAVLLAREEREQAGGGDAPSFGPRSPPAVRDDVKLGGLGLYATQGRSSRTALGSPSPPLLQEVKLSGLGAGGTNLVGSVRRVIWPSIQEVKLSGLGAGGTDLVQLRQEGNLALHT